MTWGNGPMAATPFISWATAALFLAAVLVPFGYLIGSKIGRTAGIVWVSIIFGGALAAAAGLFVWASGNGQLEMFLAEFGVDPLVEIGVFVLLIWMITGFPTIRGVLEMER